MSLAAIESAVGTAVTAFNKWLAPSSPRNPSGIGWEMKYVDFTYGDDGKWHVKAEINNSLPIRTFASIWIGAKSGAPDPDVTHDLPAYESGGFSFDIPEPGTNFKIYIATNPVGYPAWGPMISSFPIVYTQSVLDPAKDAWAADRAVKELSYVLSEAGKIADLKAQYDAARKEWTGGIVPSIEAKARINTVYEKLQEKARIIISHLDTAKSFWEMIPRATIPNPRKAVTDALIDLGYTLPGYTPSETPFATPVQITAAPRLAIEKAQVAVATELENARTRLDQLRTLAGNLAVKVKNVVTDYGSKKQALYTSINKQKISVAEKEAKYHDGIRGYRISALEGLGFVVDHATSQVTGVNTSGIAKQVFDMADEWDAITSKYPQLAAAAPTVAAGIAARVPPKGTTYTYIAPSGEKVVTTEYVPPIAEPVPTTLTSEQIQRAIAAAPPGVMPAEARRLLR